MIELLHRRVRVAVLSITVLASVACARGEGESSSPLTVEIYAAPFMAEYEPLLLAFAIHNKGNERVIGDPERMIALEINYENRGFAWTP